MVCHRADRLKTDNWSWFQLYSEFFWNSIELNIELNHFLAKFKYWIESIWVSFTPRWTSQEWSLSLWLATDNSVTKKIMCEIQIVTWQKICCCTYTSTRDTSLTVPVGFNMLLIYRGVQYINKGRLPKTFKWKVWSFAKLGGWHRALDYNI